MKALRVFVLRKPRSRVHLSGPNLSEQNSLVSFRAALGTLTATNAFPFFHPDAFRPVSPSRKKRSKADVVYEAPTETEAAIARIRGHFEKAKETLAEEKKRRSSPEGVLRSTLQALLTARKAMAIAREELDRSIAVLRRSLPRK